MTHRYVKASHRTTAPTVLVAATVETRERTIDEPGRGLRRSGLAVHCITARRRGGQWSWPTDPGRLSLADWWTWLEARIGPKSHVLVVSPIASDFLTLTRFWRETDANRFRMVERRESGDGDKAGSGKPAPPWIGQLVLAGVPDIITARCAQGAVTFVSLGNYTRAPFELLADMAGVKISPLARSSVTGPPIEPDPIEMKAVIFGTMRRLIDWWVKEENGPWRHTAGQLVVSLWRTRFYAGRICRHTDQDAAKIEKESLHGGRASVWFFGDIGDRRSIPADGYAPPGPAAWELRKTAIHRLDVSAMYPALLRNCEFPTRLVGHYRDIEVKKLRAMVRHLGMIARVRLKTTLPEFPFRADGRSGFPVGEFTTTLAGPELELALKRGEVTYCFAANRYDMGRPFVYLMNYLLLERERARRAGDSFMELLFKAWAVSFGGKFAQKAHSWELKPEVIPPRRWGTWMILPDATPEETARAKAADAARFGMERPAKVPLLHFRILAGLPYLRVEGQSGANLLAAVFAYLTAYGRLQMYALRRDLPPCSVIAQDTDGLFLTDSGLRAANREQDTRERKPGKLRLVESHTFARFFTPRHYYTDGKWTLAGIASHYIPDGPSTIRQYQAVNPIRGTPKAAPASVRYARSLVDLSRLPMSGHPDADGWAVPTEIKSDLFSQVLASRQLNGHSDE